MISNDITILNAAGTQYDFYWQAVFDDQENLIYHIIR
jgi:hypothetical protein